MEYIIEVRESYLYVKISGKISLISKSGWGEIKSALINVVNRAKKTDIYKLLIDCRDFSGTLSTFDRFLLAVFFVRENSKLINKQMHQLKISFVVNESLMDPQRFGETVARNRGLYGLVTDNIEEAIHWLEQDTPSEK
jgi:hypothetical protein